MEYISIIVPIYHGRKYIDNMIKQIEACTAAGTGSFKLELLLINDEPSEPLGSYHLKKIEIVVLETDKNRGIHAARVRGLEHSRGSLILFLDQDDRIAPNYFISQLEYLDNKDAVVCRLLHEGRQFYDARMPFEKVIQKEYMLSVRNPIISPGQVLLKRNAVPNVWQKTRLRNNGADDWLLWLCMMAENKAFALNRDILFEHVVEGSNESVNVWHMMDSEQEVYDIVLKCGLFNKEELDSLQSAVRSVAKGHIKNLCKFQKMFFVYDEWMRLQEEGKYIHTYLQSCGVGSVAIYGDSYIGKRLYRSLQDNGIEVRYFIDQNAEYLQEDIPVHLPAAGLPKTDRIIISLVESTEDIRAELSNLSDVKTVSITELLTKMKGAENQH